MKGFLFCIFFTGYFLTGLSQPDSLKPFNVRPEVETAVKEWLDDLYTFGVEIKDDSIIYNEEVQLILKDTNYRKVIYPQKYTWEVANALMNRKALKQAFWYMINLYHDNPENKELVLKLILPFDQIIDMDKIITSTYYTYIAFDPEVVTIQDGKTEQVIRPDIAEQKLHAARELVEYVQYYRTQKSGK